MPAPEEAVAVAAIGRGIDSVDSAIVPPQFGQNLVPVAVWNPHRLQEENGVVISTPLLSSNHYMIGIQILLYLTFQTPLWHVPLHLLRQDLLWPHSGQKLAPSDGAPQAEQTRTALTDCGGGATPDWPPPTGRSTGSERLRPFRTASIATDMMTAVNK